MREISAFVRSSSQDEPDPRWQRITDPPCVVSHGPHDFVACGEARAYVNGHGVVGGFQLIIPGDFVRVMRGDGGEETCFQFAGRCGMTTVPGRGRSCAMTRSALEGDAVRCDACERHFLPAVAAQIDACVCGASLEPGGAQEEPAEALL